MRRTAAKETHSHEQSQVSREAVCNIASKARVLGSKLTLSHRVPWMQNMDLQDLMFALLGEVLGLTPSF